MRGFIWEFGDNIFFAVDRVLFCKVCELKVEFERRSCVLSHIKTEKYTRMIKRHEIMLNKNAQQLIVLTNTNISK